jgi:hypothetical protein
VIQPNARGAWQKLEGQLRPFVARRLAEAADVDDVLQDIYLRIQAGVGDLRDSDRFGPWVYRVARSTLADHGRSRARHPLSVDAPAEEEASALRSEASEDGDGSAEQALAQNIAVFVAALGAACARGIHDGRWVPDLAGHAEELPPACRSNSDEAPQKEGEHAVRGNGRDIARGTVASGVEDITTGSRSRRRLRVRRWYIVTPQGYDVESYDFWPDIDDSMDLVPDGEDVPQMTAPVVPAPTPFVRHVRRAHQPTAPHAMPAAPAPVAPAPPATGPPAGGVTNSDNHGIIIQNLGPGPINIGSVAAPSNP